MSWRPAIALVVGLAAACFERGPREAPAPVGASAAVAPTDRGWRTAEPPGTPAPEATLRVALEAEPASLDPFASLDGASRRVLSLVVEGLVCLEPGGAVTPCVAARWEVGDDGRRLRFTLDPRRRFSDGRPVTPADVVASLEASRGRGHAPGPLAGVLDDATAIAATPDGAVVVEVAAARPERLHDLALVPIVPADALGAPALATAPIGTGPYAVAAWERGTRVELRRVEGAARAGASERLHFVPVADRADALRRLAAGQLEVALQVPIAEAVAATAAHPGLARLRYREPAMLVAVYNCRRPALASPASRRALTATLDRPGLARAVLGGAELVTGPWLPDDPAYDPTVIAPAFAPGGGRGGAPLTVLVPAGSTVSARLADIWAADAAGRFDLTITAVPFAELLARLAAGDFDVAITSLSAGPEVDPASRLSSDAPADAAWPGLRDSALDALFVARRAAADAATRAALGRQIHRRVAELAPMAFIAVDTRAAVIAADVGGAVDRGPTPSLWRLWRARR
jgi:peptide/nickel transport system substrate-binding protein